MSNTGSPDDNSTKMEHSTSDSLLETKTKRSQAREQVALVWQQRRVQKELQPKKSKQSLHHRESDSSRVDYHLQSGTLGETKVNKRLSSPSQINHQQQDACFFPLLQKFLGKRPAISTEEKENKNATYLGSIIPKPASEYESQSTHKSKENTRSEQSLLRQSSEFSLRYQNGFPSLLAIHQAHELSRHIETLLGNDSGNSNCPNDNHDEEKQEYTAFGPQNEQEQSSSLSILPADYDFEKAVFTMAQARSRAFWLVDLSTVVHRIVEWTRYFRTARDLSFKPPNVLFHFRVAANADPLLLQVLSRFEQVRLVVGSGWDFQRCAQSLVNYIESKTIRQCVVDDSSWTGKPDGYFRKAFFSSPDEQLGSIAVDGPDEVERLISSLYRIQARRRRSCMPMVEQAPLALTRTCLRLHVKSSEMWATLWMSTRERLRKHDHDAKLSCLSIDVSSFLEQDKICRQALQQLCALVNQFDGKLRLELTGQMDLDDEKSLLYLIELRNETWIHQFVSEISIDVTASLLSSAGALCTRVIGVKETKSEEGVRRHHYYIDDGCYGSLYQSDVSKIISIVPLIIDPERREGPTEQFLSTIWGPTCDGLDKVADKVELPKLRRDDWLIFPNQCNLGEGLGTAFNGFCPPDTAYCVLGYFRRG